MPALLRVRKDYSFNPLFLKASLLFPQVSLSPALFLSNSPQRIFSVFRKKVFLEISGFNYLVWTNWISESFLSKALSNVFPGDKGHRSKGPFSASPSLPDHWLSLFPKEKYDCLDSEKTKGARRPSHPKAIPPAEKSHEFPPFWPQLPMWNISKEMINYRSNSQSVPGLTPEHCQVRSPNENKQKEKKKQRATLPNYIPSWLLFSRKLYSQEVKDYSILILLFHLSRWAYKTCRIILTHYLILICLWPWSRRTKLYPISTEVPSLCLTSTDDPILSLDHLPLPTHTFLL